MVILVKTYFIEESSDCGIPCLHKEEYSQQHRWIGWVIPLKNCSKDCEVFKYQQDAFKMQLLYTYLILIYNTSFWEYNHWVKGCSLTFAIEDMFQIDLAETNFSIFLCAIRSKILLKALLCAKAFILHFNILTRYFWDKLQVLYLPWDSQTTLSVARALKRIKMEIRTFGDIWALQTLSPISTARMSLGKDTHWCLTSGVGLWYVPAA